MSNPPTPAEAEAHLRQLLAGNGMPQPDETLHHPAEVVFLFHETKLAITVEPTDGWLDDPSALRADAWRDDQPKQKQRR